jgi:hypothetical protein
MFGVWLWCIRKSLCTLHKSGPLTTSPKKLLFTPQKKQKLLSSPITEETQNITNKLIFVVHQFHFAVHQLLPPSFTSPFTVAVHQINTTVIHYHHHHRRFSRKHHVTQALSPVTNFHDRKRSSTTSFNSSPSFNSTTPSFTTAFINFIIIAVLHSAYSA